MGVCWEGRKWWVESNMANIHRTGATSGRPRSFFSARISPCTLTQKEQKGEKGLFVASSHQENGGPRPSTH